MTSALRRTASTAVALADTSLYEAPSLHGGGKERGAQSRPAVIRELYRAFKEEGRTLVDITWEQHRFHESRRWSAMELLSAVRLDQLTELDRFVVWNAGRAEMTAKPSADRMSRLADRECRRFLGKDPAVASVIQALGTWTRYWNEEEGHHEMGFSQLARMLGFAPIDDMTLIDQRKVFPEDDLLRTVTMLAFSEGIAAVNYGQYQRRTRDPGLKALLKHVGADEVQHMQYFIAFAKALVDSGAYEVKESFAVAHLFLRPGGELYGSAREHVESRSTHTNWWDHLESSVGAETGTPEVLERKRSLILHALKRITGISCASAEQVEEQWLELVGC